MKLLKLTSIGLLSVLAFQNIAFACDAYCAKRFSVKYTVTIPPSALIVGEDNPNIPNIKFPQPASDGGYEFWIDKSALNAEYGTGVDCKNTSAISVGFLSKDFDQASKAYERLVKQAQDKKPITLTLVGDKKYLSFHHGKPYIAYCGLFMKTFK